MTKTDHLSKAKDYIAIAESGDAKIAAYRAAAAEITAAGVTQQVAAKAIGRNQSWIQRLLKWALDYADADNPPPPFGGVKQNQARYERADRRRVEDIARERPEAIASAIAKAPAAAQRKIADGIVKSKTVEPSLRAAADPKPRAPQPAPSAERKLGDAVFALWEVGELLMDEVPADDERVRITALAEKAQRLSSGIVHLLGTGQLEDEFRQLVEEVGADA